MFSLYFADIPAEHDSRNGAEVPLESMELRPRIGCNIWSGCLAAGGPRLTGEAHYMRSHVVNRQPAVSLSMEEEHDVKHGQGWLARIR
jgi:hypothetical protein